MATINPGSTIAVLSSETTEAWRALQLTHNQSLVTSATPLRLSSEPSTSREVTPAILPLPKAEIVLTLDSKPYDPLLGFVFGSDEEICDILLSERSSQDGISRIHFRLTFDWESKSLILVDQSRYGTIVQSRFAGSQRIRNASIPILNDDTIQAGLVRLHVHIPVRGPCQDTYNKKWQELHEEYQAAIPTLNGLAIDQPKPETFMDSDKLAVLEEVGRGLTAVVFKAIDSKGFFYAVKSFNL